THGTISGSEPRPRPLFRANCHSDRDHSAPFPVTLCTRHPARRTPQRPPGGRAGGAGRSATDGAGGVGGDCRQARADPPRWQAPDRGGRPAGARRRPPREGDCTPEPGRVMLPRSPRTAAARHSRRGDVDRRAFVKQAALGAAGAGALGALGACGNAGTAGGGAEAGQVTVDGPEITWRVASSFPRSLDIIFGAAEALAQRVRDLTGGRFNLRIYPAGELVPGLQVMDAVQNGTVQAGHTAGYYYTGKHPALALD